MILKNGKRIDGASIDTAPIGILSPYLGTIAPEGYLLCQGQRVSKVRYSKLYEICKDLFGASTDTEFYLPDLRGKAITGYKEGDSTFGTLGGLVGALSHTHNIAHTHGVPGVAHTHTSAAHTHTIAGHTHTTGNHTLTVAEMPSHNHGLKEPFYKFSELNQGLIGQVYKGDKHQDNTWYSEKTGGGQAHNHGNTGSTSLTTNSTTPGATGSTTPTATATNSQSTSTSGSGSTLQPSMNLNWIVKAEMVNYTSATVYNGLDSDSTTNALSANQGKILNDKMSSLAKVATSGSYNDLINKPSSIIYQNTLTEATSSINIDNLNLIRDGGIYDIIITAPDGNAKRDLNVYINGIKKAVYQTVVGMNVQTEASSDMTDIKANSPCVRFNRDNGIYYGFSQNEGPSLIQGTFVMAGQYVMCNYTGTSIKDKKVYYIQCSCTCMEAVPNLTSLLIKANMIPGTQIILTKRA